MAFIIPNATDTASGAKYENLDQAEPDSLDFEILGNAGRSGVLSGCEVTALTASNTSVTVEGGVVVLNGQPYVVSGQSSYALPTAPTYYRFDLVVVRVSGGTASLATVSGTDTSTNVEFPKSVNSLASGVVYDSSTHVDLSTDIVLAAVYRQDAQNITTSCIADRRVRLESSISNQGTTDPTASTYVGNLYYKNNVVQGTTASGVYVQNSLGTWIELAQNMGPQVPVGSVISWIGTTTAVPAGFLEANGQTVSRATYSDLFDIIGTTYGSGDGSTTFALPDLNGKHLRGTTNTGTVGSTAGSDTTTLTTAQLPSHSHTIAHTHTVAHAHTNVHGHTASSSNTGAHSHTADGNLTVVSSGNHTHDAGNYATSNTGAHTHQISGYENDTQVGFMRRRSGYANTNFRAIDIEYDTTTFGIAVDYVTSTTSAGAHSHTVNGNTTGGAHTHDVSGNTSNTGAHSHTITVDNYNSNTGTETPTTSAASATNTGDTGSGNTVSLIPASMYVRWLIRATGTVNAVAEDGVQILSEAREEVVTVELSGSGALPASQTDAAYYRMPWAATLTAVKANRNGTNSNGSVTIDVNEGGTSVLSTAITIDVSESSSLTSATPAVISDSAIASDALITFDIDSANTSDEGPLTVTLYFTRED